MAAKLSRHARKLAPGLNWRDHCTKSWLSELKEATAKRDHQTSAQMLSRLASLASDCKEDYFWYGLELFKQIGGFGDLVRDFYEKMADGFPAMKWEWLVELSLHLMMMKSFSVALRAVNNGLTVSGGGRGRNSFLPWENILSGYSGLLSFGLWKELCEAEGGVSSSPDGIGYGNNALRRLKAIIDLPGVWDAHLIGVVEVHLIVYQNAICVVFVSVSVL
jgi:hypothetical protein